MFRSQKRQAPEESKRERIGEQEPNQQKKTKKETKFALCGRVKKSFQGPVNAVHTRPQIQIAPRSSCLTSGDFPPAASIDVAQGIVPGTREFAGTASARGRRAARRGLSARRAHGLGQSVRGTRQRWSARRADAGRAALRLRQETSRVASGRSLSTSR